MHKLAHCPKLNCTNLGIFGVRIPSLWKRITLSYLHKKFHLTIFSSFNVKSSAMRSQTFAFVILVSSFGTLSYYVLTVEFFVDL